MFWTLIMPLKDQHGLLVQLSKIYMAKSVKI